MPLPDFVYSELNSLEIPVNRITRLLSLPSWDEDQTTAFGTYIQNVYMGLERILQYLLMQKERTSLNPPRGITIFSNWQALVVLSRYKPSLS